MMKFTYLAPSFWITVLLLVAVTAKTKAQYYYKDLLSNKQVVAEKKLLKGQKIRNILVHSFEGNGETSPGFFCEKKISKDYERIETYTKSNITGKALLTSYYNAQDQLVRSNDSSELSVNNSTYTYDGRGNLSRIISDSHSNDDDFSTRLMEEHQYFFNDSGRPFKMLRIRNHKDSAVVTFTADSIGNIIDENDLGKNGKHYYYYYNEKHQLTDIVKYNVVKNKLIPDIIFSYNTDGMVTQMIALEEGVSNDYYTWKYVYNDGLRIIEKCYSKEKILLGYFEYEYN